MATKRGRTVTPAERPVYAHCTRLFLDGRIGAFWAYSKNEWEFQGATGLRVVGSFEDVKGWLRRLDPDGCTWDTTGSKRTGKATLVDLTRRLLDALVTGDCPEPLIIEARAALAAA